jgi:hypothetical protein
MRARGWILLSFMLASGHAWAAGRVHHYHVTVAPELDSLQVQAQLSSPVSQLRSRDREARRNTHDVIDCDAGGRLEVRGRTLLSRSATCIQYEFDLTAERPSRRRSFLLQFPDNRLVSPASWLWLPRLDADTEIRVSFDLPEGVNVSVPWLPVDSAGENAYRFGTSPASSEAIAVFGDFSYHEIEVPGATLRVTLLQGDEPSNPDDIVSWLRAAAGNLTHVYGRFPNPSPQVIVVPFTSFGNSAVPFGRVIRDGGEAVQFFVDPSRSLQDYLGDWTATHEFSHLLLPYVSGRRKWISEGFASYYQNVLMARSGAYSETKAWQKLHEGFERARAERPTSPNNAKSRMMVYWSGAAIALLADVALRQTADDASLDTLLDQLQACCLPSERTWDGRELFTKLDELGGTQVLSGLYRRYANRRGMPDLTTLYEQLGIEVREGKVHLDDAAEHANLRQAIMAPNNDVTALLAR